MRIEFEPLAVAPAGDDEGVPELRALLRAEVTDGGPMTFARFMQLALYEPGLGYYATSAERTTRAGDFLTAPEVHPIFGHVLAAQIDQMWRLMDRPDTFTLREYGAGSGSLVLAVLDGLRRSRSDVLRRLRYQPVDLPAQLAAIRARLAAAGHERLVQDSPSDEALTGCVVANEYLDALPVHRVVMDGGRLCEIYVGWRDDGPAEVIGELSDARLARWFDDRGVQLAEGQRAEVSLAMVDWLSDVGRRLERGYVLLFDYGAPAAELYGPERSTGTVRSFRGQHVSSDVLGGMGLRDITAHVDLDALEQAARIAGLDVLGRTRQAAFLLGAGLDDVYATARRQADSDWQTALMLRSAVRRLLDPMVMGGYGVVVLGKSVDRAATLDGLSGGWPPRPR